MIIYDIDNSTTGTTLNGDDSSYITSKLPDGYVMVSANPDKKNSPPDYPVFDQLRDGVIALVYDWVYGWYYVVIYYQSVQCEQKIKPYRQVMDLQWPSGFV